MFEAVLIGCMTVACGGLAWAWLRVTSREHVRQETAPAWKAPWLEEWCE